MAAQTAFQRIGGVVIDGVAPGFLGTLPVRRMKRLAPAVAIGFFQRQAGVFPPLRIEIGVATLGVANPDDLRHGFGQQAKFLFTGGQRIAYALALGDVAHHRQDAGLTVDDDDLGRHQRGQHSPLLAQELGIEIHHAAVGQQALDEFRSRLRIVPDTDFARSLANDFVAPPAKGGFKALVDIHVQTVRQAGQHDGLRTGHESGAVAQLAFLQLGRALLHAMLQQGVLLTDGFFRQVLGADVAKHQHHALDVAAGVVDGGGAVGNRALGAVAGNQQRVVGQGSDLTGGQHLGHRDHGSPARLFMNDPEHFANGPATGLFCGPAGQLLGHGVHAGHARAGVGRHHGIAY